MKTTRSEAVAGIVDALGISRSNVTKIHYPPNSTNLFIDYVSEGRKYFLTIDFDAGVELVNDDKSDASYVVNDDSEAEKLRRALQVAIKKQYRLKARLDESKLLNRVFIDQLRSSKRPQSSQSRGAHDSSSRRMACCCGSNRSAG